MQRSVSKGSIISLEFNLPWYCLVRDWSQHTLHRQLSMLFSAFFRRFRDFCAAASWVDSSPDFERDLVDGGGGGCTHNLSYEILPYVQNAFTETFSNWAQNIVSLQKMSKVFFRKINKVSHDHETSIAKLITAKQTNRALKTILTTLENGPVLCKMDIEWNLHNWFKILHVTKTAIGCYSALVCLVLLRFCSKFQLILWLSNQRQHSQWQFQITIVSRGMATEMH